MVFSSKDELTEYYKSYAESIGFGVSKLSSKNGVDGKKYFTLACSRGTKYCKQNSFGWNGQSATNNLAPFNPNSGLITEVNQVPFYSQVMNHGASYFQLLQAQYPVNDLSSSRDEVNDQLF
ncbi:hypothetical protein QL285_056645 [Trifolium repens]|nr:hypothetical protein QL285_056645 [Trifolium repens]